jgi:hypothetical protein
MAAYGSGIDDNIDVDAATTKIYIADHIGIHMNYLPIHITWIRCACDAILDYLPLNIEFINNPCGNAMDFKYIPKFYNLPPFIYRIAVYSGAIKNSSRSANLQIIEHGYMAWTIYKIHEYHLYNIITRKKQDWISYGVLNTMIIY